MNIAEITQNKQVLQDKLNRTIENRLDNNKNLIETIERDGNLLKDQIMLLGNNGHMRFESNGKVYMNTENGKFKLHNNAIGQLSDKIIGSTSVTRYLRKMAVGEDWQRELVAKILNEHTEHSDRQRVLVRSISDEVRGVLSDRYRRLNTNLIYGKFLESVNRKGAVVIDAFYNDTKSYIDVVFPEVIDFKISDNETEFVAFGASITSSDFGNGALDFKGYLMKVVCLNGMVTSTKLREVHLGSRLPDNINFSEQTYQLDTATMSNAIGDMVDNHFSFENVKEQLAHVQELHGVEVDLDKEIKQLPKIGVLKGEVKLLEKTFRDNNESDGVNFKRNSLWKLTTGLGAVANKVDDDERRRELLEISGKLSQRIK